MPTLIIHTNVETPAARRKQVLKDASFTVASFLDKPESYVMVILKTGQDMLFAGDDAPLAYLELKSLGLPEASTADFSSALSGFMNVHFNIPPARIYIQIS